MEEGRGLKRDFVECDADERHTQQKKLMFPKGKKLKTEGRLGFTHVSDRGLSDQISPNVATKERAKRRIEKKEEFLFGNTTDVSVSEVQYEDDSTFEIDGIEIEPFNLKQEREEGYFDENGNYVEYKHEQEIKDAWLDSVSMESRFSEKIPVQKIAEEAFEDLSPEEILTTKRRITNILQPGETIIHALKRLKGTSLDKRAKMSDSTKHMFDQLTEDAMKLMESGEYNVYHQEREIFVQETANKDGEKYDMFGDDDDEIDANRKPNSDVGTFDSTSSSGQTTHPASESQEASQCFDSTEVSTGGLESDYVYDPSSGYYYSTSLGYYYDPTSMLYCSAVSGIWYSFDEQLGTYTEVNSASTQET